MNDRREEKDGSLEGWRAFVRISSYDSTGVRGRMISTCATGVGVERRRLSMRKSIALSSSTSERRAMTSFSVDSSAPLCSRTISFLTSIISERTVVMILSTEELTTVKSCCSRIGAMEVETVRARWFEKSGRASSRSSSVGRVCRVKGSQ